MTSKSSSFRPAKYPDGKTPKGRYDRTSIGATRPGATHKQGKVFLGRNILSVSPSAFRKMHLGRTSQRWEKVQAANGS